MNNTDHDKCVLTCRRCGSSFEWSLTALPSTYSEYLIFVYYHYEPISDGDSFDFKVVLIDD